MPHDLLLQGRRLRAPELVYSQHWLAAPPDGPRPGLARELGTLWNWRHAAGQRKDRVCRSLWLQLETRGLIAPPTRPHASVNGQRQRRLAAFTGATTPRPAELPTAAILLLKTGGRDWPAWARPERRAWRLSPDGRQLVTQSQLYFWTPSRHIYWRV